MTTIEDPLMFTLREYPVTTFRGKELRIEVSQAVQGNLAAIHMDVLLLDEMGFIELYETRKHTAEFCAGQVDMYRSSVTGVRLNPALEFKGFPAAPPVEAYTLTADRHDKPQWVW